jgi:Domain of unknown function (DUF397)
MTGAGWRKSSYSGNSGGNCVEVAVGRQAVAVRDSKDPHGPMLALTPERWMAFTAWCRSPQCLVLFCPDLLQVGVVASRDRLIAVHLTAS